MKKSLHSALLFFLVTGLSTNLNGFILMRLSAPRLATLSFWPMTLPGKNAPKSVTTVDIALRQFCQFVSTANLARGLQPYSGVNLDLTAFSLGHSAEPIVFGYMLEILRGGGRLRVLIGTPAKKLLEKNPSLPYLNIEQDQLNYVAALEHLSSLGAEIRYFHLHAKLTLAYALNSEQHVNFDPSSHNLNALAVFIGGQNPSKNGLKKFPDLGRIEICTDPEAADMCDICSLNTASAAHVFFQCLWAKAKIVFPPSPAT